MRFLLLSINIFFFSFVNAQTPKKVLVEHFTNTKCSICASRNPGFYSNLNINPNVLHIAFHPSSPYSTCVLNNYNVSENDSRTNYYGIYGSTPRLVINGVVISGNADYSNSGIFTPYSGQNSDFSLTLKQTKIGTDSIQINISIKKLKSVSIATATLFAGIFEDTIFYAAPNGETKHFDVFRNSYSGAQGTVIAIPTNIGDSTIYTKTIKLNSTVNVNRIYSLAILQNSTTKEMLQAEKTATLGNPNANGINNNQISSSLFKLYPNPVSTQLFIESQSNEIVQLIIYNALGKEIQNHNFSNSLTLNVSTLPKGMYFIHAVSMGILQREVFLKN